MAPPGATSTPKAPFPGNPNRTPSARAPAPSCPGADDLFTPGFFSHPLGTTGFEAGKDAWRTVVPQFPGMRVVAQDILVDGDKVAVRSSVEGIASPDGGSQPMLIEIFRIDDGRLAETWGITEGPDPRLS
jgi:hypothetical protein